MKAVLKLAAIIGCLVVLACLLFVVFTPFFGIGIWFNQRGNGIGGYAADVSVYLSVIGLILLALFSFGEIYFWRSGKKRLK